MLKFIIIILFLYVLLGFISTNPKQNVKINKEVDTSLIRLSEELLYQVKMQSSTKEIESKLQNLDEHSLMNGLLNDDAKKTFWINIYNAYYQILAKNIDVEKSKIYIIRKITIANNLFSLDDIEHGILRKYRWKYSMGYLPQFFPKKNIKQLAVKEIDFRIHFALNCGAKSCPPIAFYSYQKINQQLDLATTSFLTSETEFDDERKIVKVTKIMSWFLGDFDGKKGIRNILEKYLHKNVESYSIEFKPYNWDTDLNNFSK